ncbi:hypothetical protein K438DRAFT_2030984 [Mycena galopus ATCC 62051]|nr:hypothetical protein K438DRAFT_2030984 [Mycena galopus ATCC 62051]
MHGRRRKGNASTQSSSPTATPSSPFSLIPPISFHFQDVAHIAAVSARAWYGLLWDSLSNPCLHFRSLFSGRRRELSRFVSEKEIQTCAQRDCPSQSPQRHAASGHPRVSTTAPASVLSSWEGAEYSRRDRTDIRTGARPQFACNGDRMTRIPPHQKDRRDLRPRFVLPPILSRSQSHPRPLTLVIRISPRFASNASCPRLATYETTWTLRGGRGVRRRVRVREVEETGRRGGDEGWLLRWELGSASDAVSLRGAALTRGPPCDGVEWGKRSRWRVDGGAARGYGTAGRRLAVSVLPKQRDVHRQWAYIAPHPFHSYIPDLSLDTLMSSSVFTDGLSRSTASTTLFYPPVYPAAPPYPRRQKHPTARDSASPFRGTRSGGLAAPSRTTMLPLRTAPPCHLHISDSLTILSRDNLTPRPPALEATPALGHRRRLALTSLEVPISPAAPYRHRLVDSQTEGERASDGDTVEGK